MNEYDRILYVLWWECGVSNNWYVIGTYTSRAEVLKAARHCLEHDDGSGWYYVNYITLNDKAYKLTEHNVNRDTL